MFWRNLHAKLSVSSAFNNRDLCVHTDRSAENIAKMVNRDGTRCWESRQTSKATPCLLLHKQEIRFRAGSTSQGFLQHVCGLGVWGSCTALPVLSVCCCRTTHSSGHLRPPSCLCRLLCLCFRSFTRSVAVNQQTLAAHLTKVFSLTLPLPVGDPLRLMRVFPLCQTLWRRRRRHRNFAYRISNATME